MNIGNFIALGLIIITAYGVFKVYMNEVKHLKENVKKMWKIIEKIQEDLKENSEQIARLEGKLNGR